MTKEQEAQQAQTIARIKQEYERHSGRTYHAFTDFAPLVTELYANLSVLLEIVDSQAQKIEQQDADIANLLNKLANWPATYERQEQKIAEQAKEIERLKDLVRKISGAEPDPFNIVAGVRRSHNKQQTVKR